MNPLPKQNWQERVIEINRFHVERCRADDTWTISKTAKLLNRSHGSIAQDLLLASWLRTHPKIEKFKYLSDALEFVRSRKKELKLSL